MKVAELEKLVTILETFDKRMSDADKRAVKAESHIAESAQATEEIAKSVHKLSELYVSIDRRLEDMNTMMANYIDAMRGRLEQAKKTEDAAKGLVSEIRKRCPEGAVGG